MVYFTSQHYTPNVSTITNNKGEGQPLRSTESTGHYHTMSPTDISSSCTIPGDTDSISPPPPKRQNNTRRSTWSDQSVWAPSLVDQGYNDAPKPIQTSFLQLDLNDAILCELRWMTLLALLVCLLCPVGGTLIVFCITTKSTSQYGWIIQQFLQPLLVVFWCLFVAFWQQHSPDRINTFFSWTQRLCLITLISLFPIPTLFDTLPEYTYILMTTLSICLCLFYMAQRLIDANERQRLGFQHQTKDQQALIQQHVAFLSIVTNEIQDAALMILTTLEQFSPSIILTNTQELLSACSIAVPITSISAIHTTIKQVCHVSSEFKLLSCLVRESNKLNTPPVDSQVFDIGELCQSVGDALAGMASKLDVNLVLYHSESSLHHTQVIGDESALRHALLDLLRNILEGSTPGACIELGLNLVAIENNKNTVTILIDIIHTCSPVIPDHLSSMSILLPNSDLTTRLINYFGGQFKAQNLSNSRTRFEVKVDMDLKDRGSDPLLFIHSNEAPTTGSTTSLHKSYHHIKFANEPTMQDLVKFMENLKGLKMVLHAKEQSVFAKHLTGCLASWNCDISHVPVSRLDDDDTLSTDENIPTTPSSDGDSIATTPQPAPVADHPVNYRRHYNQLDAKTAPLTPPPSSSISNTHVPSPVTEEEQLLSIPPAFVLIDDHILTLERKLLEFRTRSTTSANGRRLKYSKATCHGSTTAIIYFTSLTNYKSMRDIIQWAATLSTPYAMPRVVVVPKPAGPRRYLTALHTAWHNAMVEPHYISIATSPSSPVPTVLLSSMLSQVIDHTSNFTPPATGHDTLSLRRLSSSNHHSTNINEGSNYFFDRSAVDNQQSNSRRRSHNDLIGSSSKEILENTVESHLGRTHLPATTSGLLEGTTPVAAAAASAAVDEFALITSMVNDPTLISSISLSNELPINHLPPVNTLVPLQETVLSPGNMELSPMGSVGLINNASTLTGDAPDSTNATQSDAVKSVPRIANVRLSKRKKKEKGSLFSNVISPPINVLIVEDNMINQAILSAWMKKHKIKFSVASNGQEAVEKWQGGGFHLVLMDIQLPVMSGIDATKMIRSIEKEQKIGVLPMSSSLLRQQQQANESEHTTTDTMDITKMARMTTAPPSIFRSPVIIVALTASSLESDRHTALAAGCNDFLTKPVSLEWLEKKIIEWGCMQALIDFEGWRRWKRSANDEDLVYLAKKQQQGESLAHVALEGMDTLGRTSFLGQSCSQDLPGDNNNNNNNNDDKSLIDRFGRKGILLPGAINKRRFSTVEKQTLRRHNTGGHQMEQHKPSIARGPSRLHAQDINMDATSGRRKVTKKAISVDDYMRTATFVG